ncbi:L-rhamnose mutarotase [Adhaeribacter aquaticus]|uniref:L-rhamnose mutarotase n=1 Tax=Adhaeribacter aquaticus TaxID=299567 RepID=UPI000403C191|nr:L-rhamnose mutarotase [Adhaeribacter aquaticus]
MQKFCLALDLKDDAELIAEYEFWHGNVWPEIKRSIMEAGILNMEIYRFQNRLFMIMETDDAFTFDKKTALDKANPKVQEWEELMWQYQQAIPGTPAGQKWVLMNKIFEL